MIGGYRDRGNVVLVAVVGTQRKHLISIQLGQGYRADGSPPAGPAHTAVLRWPVTYCAYTRSDSVARPRSL